MATEMVTSTAPATDYDAQLNEAWKAMHKIEQDFEQLVGRPLLRGRGGGVARGRGGAWRRPVGSFAGLRSRYAEINEKLHREPVDFAPRGDSFGFRDRPPPHRPFDRPPIRDRPVERYASEMGAQHEGQRRMDFGRRPYGMGDFESGFQSRTFGRERLDESRSQYGFSRRRIEPLRDIHGDRYENRWMSSRDVRRDDLPPVGIKRRYEYDNARYGPPSPPEPQRDYDDSEWVEKQPEAYGPYEEMPPVGRNSLYESRRENAPLPTRYNERRENFRYAEPPRRRRLEENHARHPPTDEVSEEAPRKVARHASRHSPIIFNREELQRSRSPIAAELPVKKRPSVVRKPVAAVKAPYDSKLMAQRNKRMFNSLLSTLQTFDKEQPAGYVAQTKKIKEVAERLEQEHEETVKKIMDEKRKILEMRRQQRLEIKRLTRKRGIAVSYQAEIDHLKQLQNFIVTNTKPPIYYLPVKHSIRSIELQKKTKKQIEESISAISEEMESRLKQVDEQIHFEPEGEGDEAEHDSSAEDNQVDDEADGERPSVTDERVEEGADESQTETPVEVQPPADETMETTDNTGDSCPVKDELREDDDLTVKSEEKEMVDCDDK